MEPNLAGSIYEKRTILPYVLFLVTAAMFVGRMEPNEKFYRGSYIDASCQVWLHSACQDLPSLQF
jgi:hypothetical protein